ncbi:MAG: 4-hydroxythreonine-4-phosphate dehydrogenase PdxA [Gammaproteobacteria bacterium]|nr:4-hydroxythreonine-4-phosphate dehydrogenase PdxA [Gammaproteobacteria bacterium]
MKLDRRATVPRPNPLALTPGEPAGIGPDLCVGYAQHRRDIPVIAVCDPLLLHSRAEQLDLPLELETFQATQRVTCAPGRLTVEPISLAVPAVTGSLNKLNANYVLSTLRRSVEGCLAGEFSGLVTGPVHKGVINDSGTVFSGHTEYLAQLTQATPVMMLTCPGLRVALATTHLPLAQVSRAITRESLATVIRILHRDLKERFGIPSPRILVCGLNPHAGEGGHLGHEEHDIIQPVVDELRRTGIDLRGPLPADTAFTAKFLDESDSILAMYHDQGLPVLKHLGFGRAVNITLGLPIIRTSVDHGTALDLAGSGRADRGSLDEAVQTAWKMAQAVEDKSSRLSK